MSEWKNGGKREGESSTSGFQVITSSLLFTNSESKWATNSHCSLLSLGLCIHDRVVEVAVAICLESPIRTLRSDDGDGNEEVKKAIGLITKTTTLLVHHAFFYISLPSLYDYDVKMPNLIFYRGSTQATTKFPLRFCWTWLWFLEIQL